VQEVYTKIAEMEEKGKSTFRRNVQAKLMDKAKLIDEKKAKAIIKQKTIEAKAK